MLFISHDLGVVGEIADRVVVMRRGRCASRTAVEAIFTAPQDAATRALLACRPRSTARRAAGGHRRPHRRQRAAAAPPPARIGSDDALVLRGPRT